MTSKDRIGIGQIGLGSWGPNLLRNFMIEASCDVLLVSDLKESNFTRLELGDAGPAFTSDYRDILRDPRIGAVVVATPSETHCDIGMQVLGAGKHLFVEKPFALSSREARKMVGLARRKGLKIMVGHLLMYHPGVRTLVGLLNEGAVGRIFFIGIRRRNLGRLQSDCSVLWDLGPHDISIALMVVGREPEKVVATGQSYLQPGKPEVVFTTITFEGGVQAHIEESWLAHERERELLVVGEKGMLVFDETAAAPLKLFRKAVRLRSDREIKEFDYIDGGADPLEVAAEQPLEAECRHFLACLRSGENPMSDGANGLQVLRVLEAADRSLRHGGRIVHLPRRK